MAQPHHSTAAGRRPDPAKRAAILSAAQTLFASHGFSATSMDAVAQAAGVSKLTAYRHFGSKDQLFAEAVTARCSDMLGPAELELGAERNPREMLVAFGKGFLDLILHDEALAVHRLVIAERDRAPQLGQIFHAAAIMPTSERLARLIERLGLPVSDPVTAATDLLALWRGKPMLAVEMGLPRWTHADVIAHIERAVDLCIAGWIGLAKT